MLLCSFPNALDAQTTATQFHVRVLATEVHSEISLYSPLGDRHS